MKKRARATKAMKRYARTAKPADYAKMVIAASSVVVQNRGKQYRTGNPEYVLFEFPFWVNFAPDFPKGYIVAKTRSTNTYKINAIKLLDWLFENGHSTYNTRILVAAGREFDELDRSIERIFKINA